MLNMLMSLMFTLYKCVSLLHDLCPNKTNISIDEHSVGPSWSSVFDGTLFLNKMWPGIKFTGTLGAIFVVNLNLSIIERRIYIFLSFSFLNPDLPKH